MQQRHARVCLHACDTCCGSVSAAPLSLADNGPPGSGDGRHVAAQGEARDPSVPLSWGEVEWHLYYGDAKHTMVSRHNARALHSLLCSVTLFMELQCVCERERRKKRGDSHPSKKKKELCEKVGLQLLFALSLIWSGATVALVSPSPVWISQSDDEENQHRGFKKSSNMIRQIPRQPYVFKKKKKKFQRRRWWSHYWGLLFWEAESLALSL